MSGLSVQNLSKSYGGRDLFAALSFDVADGSRLALVGPNGCGKSTLLRILAGVAEADRGEIKASDPAGVGYVAQEFSPGDLEQGILAFVLAVFPSWAGFWARWEEALATGDEAALSRLAAEQAELEARFGYNPEHKAESVLMGLGFSRDDLHKSLGQFSGGWRERAKLARVLVQGTSLLLLDEPTNHLDLEAVEWLEQYLLGFAGAVVFVAHDRVFLDRVATHVLPLGTARAVPRRGNFTQYVAWLEEQEVVRARQAEKIEAGIARQMDYIRRFRVKARKAAQAQSKLKVVEKLKEELSELTPERRRKTLSFSLPTPEPSEKVVIQAVDLVGGYVDRPPLWSPLSFTVYRGQKIALVAPNGAGKSTLIKLLVGQLRPQEGHVILGAKTRLGYYSQHQTEILNLSGTVIGEMRRLSDPRCTEEQLMSTLGLFLLGEDFFDRPVERLSGGEKSRLVLASLFLKRCNFLVLDEPTNHLDLESREALIEALSAFEGTLLLVAHDRWLMQEVAAEAWALSHDGMTRHMGGFAEYERCRRDQAREAGGEETGSCPAPEQQMRKRLDKEEKRRRAELRNTLYRELKPKKEAYDRLEAELDQVASAQAELERVLALPETYADQSRFVQLTSDYKRTKEREEELFLELSGLEAAIGELEARRAELAAGEEG
ncbi:ABC transporter related protein [Desulfovibrio sp. X2]|uniref:ribosomal protection-like ABC-F family protein n=1 Tax=Desulfovibrio sp. X2 TaxID=941449 RepID=UPI0003588285|nr:ABC-F family ATP-binding cassette domain-containing protein [Desulfovibrio sp. X2]EPR42672.1 ABC transporter related protein [Desulfovibrio sp. X2]